MPRYQYKCHNCDADVTITHSMDETLEKCPKCHHINTMKKVYAVIRKATKPTTRKVKVGTKVKEYIKTVKQAVKEEKERLQKGKYKP